MGASATIDSNHIVALFTPDMAALRKAGSAGIKSVVDFRAEGEKGLPYRQEREAAEAAGLNYLSFPVTSDKLDDDLVDSFRRLLDDLPQPLFLHCASGTRAAAMTLMALAADKGWSGSAALEEGRKRGIDLSEEKIGEFVRSYADRQSGR